MEQEEKKELEARQNVETEAPSPSKDSRDAHISSERRKEKVRRIHVETAVPLGEPGSSGLSRQENVTDKVVSLLKGRKHKAAASKDEIKAESIKKSGSVEASNVKQPKQHGAPIRPKSEFSVHQDQYYDPFLSLF